MELTRSDIEQLLKVIDSAPFDVIHIEWKGLKLSLKRGGEGGAFDPTELTQFSIPPTSAGQDPSPPPVQASEAAGTSDSPPMPTTPAPAVDTVDTDSGVSVKSPTVGIFYRRPEPSAPPFVEEGERVEEGDTLCLIEVMKVFTAITAEVSGTLERVLVEDNAMVEHDQILMLITPDD